MESTYKGRLKSWKRCFNTHDDIVVNTHDDIVVFVQYTRWHSGLWSVLILHIFLFSMITIILQTKLFLNKINILLYHDSTCRHILISVCTMLNNENFSEIIQYMYLYMSTYLHIPLIFRSFISTWWQLFSLLLTNGGQFPPTMFSV